MKDLKKWLKAAGIRALKTIGQAAVAMIPAAIAIQDVNWPHVLGVALLAGAVSMFTSMAGLPELEGTEK